MPTLEALRCDRCKTFVRRWETWHDASDGSQVFKAYCHGETDECRVDWRGLPEGKIIECVAFRGVRELPKR